MNRLKGGLLGSAHLICGTLLAGLSLASGASTLLNVNFAAFDRAKTGFAATGQTSSDFWNNYTAPFNPSAALTNLHLADGTVTSIGLTVQNGAGHISFAHPDLMYNCCCYAQNLADITLTVTNLPTGQYDFYLYGHSADATANTVFQAFVGTTNYGNKSTATDDSWSLTNWVEGAQYVVYRNVQITNGGAPFTAKAHPGLAGYTFLNGLQIVGTATTPPIACTPPPSGLVSWWRGEANSLDQAGTNNGTLIGNTTFGAGRAGQSFVFDGSGDGVNVGNPTNLRLQNFTIEAWVKRSSSSVASLTPWQSGAIFAYDWGGYGFGLWDDGRPFLTKVGYDNISPTFAITDTNSFHHVAVTKTGTNVVFYLDGVGQSVGAYTSTFEFGGPAAIGARGGDYDSSLLGSVDEVSVYNRALSAGEIQGIYSSGSAGKCSTTNPTNCAPPGIISWWPMDANANDIVGANSGALTGNAGFGPGEVGQSLICTGAPGGIVVSNSPSLNFGPGADFSIEAWIKPLVASTAYDVMNIVDKRIAPNDDLTSIGYEFNLIGGKLETEISDSLSKPYLIVGAVGPDLRDGAWHHVAATFQRTNSTGGKLYVDGQQIFTFDPTSQQGDLTTTAPLLIGMHPNYPRLDANFRGGIDEVSLYGRSLTPTEILGIFNAGSGGKCRSGTTSTPPFIVSQPAAQTVIVGANAAFNVVAGGSQPLSYQWRLNGTNISAATASSLTISNVQVSQAGNYAVQVTNNFGSILSSNAVLVVNANPTNCVTPPSGLVGWWKGDGNTLDQAGTNNGTLAGNTTYAAGRVGQGFVFDGNGDGVLIGNPTALQLQNFTIESWIKRSSTSTVSSGTAGIGVIVGYGLSGYALALFPSGQPFLTQVGAGNTGPAITITDTSYHHLAVTKTNSTIVFYVDGVSYPAPNYNPAFVFNTPLGIGAKGDGFDNSILGTVDEAAIYNRALSAAEVVSIYNADGSGKCAAGTPPSITNQPQSLSLNAGATANFSVTAGGTAPLSYQWTFNGTNVAAATTTSLTISNVQVSQAGNYAVRVTNNFGSILSSNAVLVVNGNPTNCVAPPSGLVGWWKGDGNTLDQSSTNNGTLAGNTTYGAGRVGQGFVFDGNGDGVLVGNPAALQLQNFTVESWIKRSSTSTVSSGTAGIGVIVGYGLSGYALALFPSGQPFLTQVGAGNTGPAITITDTNFHHLAVTKTNSTIVFYVDGVSYPAPNYNPGFVFNTPLGIGAKGDAFDNSFLGTVDEAAIYNRVLSAAEIVSIYNANGAGKCAGGSSSNCTPAGLVSWWPFQSNAVDIVSGHNGTLTGNVSFASSEVGAGLNIASVPGGVVVPNSSDLNFGPGVDFSIEAWIRPVVASTSFDAMNIVDKRLAPNDSSAIGYEFDMVGGKLELEISDSLSKPYLIVGGVGPDLRDGLWHHVALTIQRTNTTGGKFYVDGQAIFTFDPTSQQGDLSNTQPLLIGLFADYPRLDLNFRGGIDELSMYRRALAQSEILAIFNTGSAGKCGIGVPPSITNQPQSLTLNAGATANFSVTAGGTAPLSYQWTFNGTNIASATTTSLTVSNVVVSQSGNYAVRVTNTFGSILSSNAVLVVNANPTNCTPASSGLVSWWKAEGNALDQSSTNNGTLAGNTSYGAGRAGQGFVFDGNGDGVRVGNPAALQLQNFTIESWIKRSSTTTISSGTAGIGVIVGYGLSGYALALFPSGQPFLTQVGAGNTAPAITITDTNFHHLAVTKTNSTIVFYVDGVSYPAPNYNPGFVFNTPLGIGAKGDAFDNSFLGTVDEAAIYNRVLSAAEIVSIYNADGAGKCTTPPPGNCVPPPSNLVSWWKGEGNALDQIGGNNGILSGNVTFGAAEVGQGFVIDGTGPLVIISNTASLQMQDMTIETWIRRASTSVASRDGNGNGHIFGFASGGYTIYMDPAGHPSFGKTGFNAITCPAIISDTNLHHFALTKSGSTNIFYIDGVTFPAVSYEPGFTFSGPVYIGGVASNANFYGTIDEVSVYSRALAAGEVIGIYNANGAGKCSSTNPTNCAPPGIISWWPMDANANDIVGANSGTLTGNAGFGPGEVGQSLICTGAPGGIVVSNSPSLNFGPGADFSIEAWIKPLVASTAYDVMNIVDKRLAPNDSTSIGYEFNLIGGKLETEISDSLSKPYLIVGAVGPDLRDGAWHHVAATFQRTNSTGGKLYVDGQQIFTFDPTSQQGDLTTTAPLIIGMHPDYPRLDANFRGGIDEVSLYGRSLTPTEILGIFNAGSGGKCRSGTTFTPPFIISQPVAQTVIVGANAAFNVVAGGSQPLSYQWRLNGTNISAATASSFTISNAQPANAGLYSVLVSNSVSSVVSSNALLTVNPGPSLLRVGDAAAASGATVTVPVLLTASGYENALQFSLNFSPSKLTYVSAILASGGGATLFLNESGTSTGRVGMVIGLPAGATFPAGTQELAEVTFTTGIATNPTTTPISFVDQPVVRQVADTSGSVLSATYTTGTVSIAAAVFEADLSPRPNGDKNVTVTDWILIGRFAAHLDSPTNASEFQRADCAPRATLGNGAISITDWVQAGRYAAALDPLTPVGGPTSPTATLLTSARKTKSSTLLSTRQLRAVDTSLNQGQTGTLAVSLQAQGNENALGFSLSFDPGSLTYSGAALGSAAAGATLNVNTDNIAAGRIGFALALSSGAHFAAGLDELVKVTFKASSSATGTVSVAFADLPIDREISDLTANALSSDYLAGAIAINPLPSLTILQAGPNISLTWPSWATNFVLQENGADLNSSGTWSNVDATITTGNNQNSVTVPMSGITKVYRLLKQ